MPHSSILTRSHHGDSRPIAPPTHGGDGILLHHSTTARGSEPTRDDERTAQRDTAASSVPSDGLEAHQRHVERCLALKQASPLVVAAAERFDALIRSSFVPGVDVAEFDRRVEEARRSIEVALLSLGCVARAHARPESGKAVDRVA